ncbi:MAG: glycoside hydrolase family 28 protein [Ignavibacteriaceae bacterium]
MITTKNNMKKFFFFLFLTAVSAMAQTNSFYNVKEFGAKGNGTYLDTKSIQAAIDSCHRSGGGTVSFPAGQYLTGSILLKSNVFLEIDNGATILGNTSISDYKDTYFIYAEGAKNIGVTGPGFINGQGDSFWKGKERPYVRPHYVIYFNNCENVTIKDINIRNAPRFSIYLRGCDIVRVDGISIINDRDAPNTDGIDPSGSSNVFISNCYISTGDDAICLKSDDAKSATSNVVVSNCILETDDSAIKCGTGSRGIIQNSTFNNIVIKNSRYGISLFMKDGGKFEDLKFSNILLQTETAEYAKPGRYSFPIFMDIEKRDEASRPGQIKDISFDNINIETYNGNCLFLGQPDDEIEGVVMNDITMKILKRIDYSKRHKPRGTRTLKNVASNDYANVSSHLTFAYVNGLTIRNLTIKDDDPETGFERYSLWGKDIRDVLIDGLKTEQIIKNKSYPTIEMIDGKDVTIRDCEPDSNKVGFLGIEGRYSHNIKLIDNDLSGTAKAVRLGGGASKGSVHVLDEKTKN